MLGKFIMPALSILYRNTHFIVLRNFIENRTLMIQLSPLLLLDQIVAIF
jgi:hypothetical protein